MLAQGCAVRHNSTKATTTSQKKTDESAAAPAGPAAGGAGAAADAAGAQAAEPAVVHATHPRLVYRRQMRELRKKYAAEVAALRASEEAEAAMARTTSDKELRRQQEIEELKKKREAFLRGIDAFVAPMKMPSPIDAVLGSDGLADKPKRKPETESKKDENGDPIDDIFEERRAMWLQFFIERRKRRFLNLVQHKQSLAQQRLEALTYLFHASANFVTYRNLDAKIAEVTRHKTTPGSSVPQMLARAEQAMLTGDNTPIFVTSASAASLPKTSREAALKQAVGASPDVPDATEIRSLHEKHRDLIDAANASSDSYIPANERFSKPAN
ncbi:hypothetical protein HK105_204311 [Polyrhizophydium stewartii]|uniref:Uncharacterized protein n=1 Tax=Polyrhizophydium stewartii TaxID=2732419 RepID=A0ABR4N9L4_9FUNG